MIPESPEPFLVQREFSRCFNYESEELCSVQYPKGFAKYVCMTSQPTQTNVPPQK